MAQLFVSSRRRGTLEKLWALTLAVSINLPALAGAITPTSAYAIAPTPTTIFSDGFEGSDPYANWDSHGNKWQGSTLNRPGSAGTKSAKVEGNTQGEQMLSKFVSTNGYQDVEIEFWYKADNLEHSDNDYVKLQWTVNGGQNWTNDVVIDSDNDDNHWHKVSTPLGSPTPDDAAQFGFRFVADLDAGNDTVWIDDVIVRGTLITPYSPENTLERCTNDTDDDHDGLTDFGDSDCAAFKPKLTVTKLVIGGSKTVSDFPLHAAEGDALTPLVSGEAKAMLPGTYMIGESTDNNYTADFTSGACGLDGSVTLVAGIDASCTLTNTFIGSLCEDGLDNDGDSKIDMQDPGCTGADDNSETDPVLPPACEDTSSTVTVVSSPNNTTLENGSPAVATYDDHLGWTATIPGATWVWESEEVTAPEAEQRASFFDVFIALGDPTSATLTIAADNAYEVWVNNHYVGGDLGGNNFQSTDTIQIPIEMIQLGLNSIRIEVTNHALEGAGPHDNPAGLLYKLEVVHNTCNEIDAPSCDSEANLIANGGFEAPNVLSTEFGSANGWDIIPDTDAALQWLVDWVTPQDGGRLGLEIQRGVAGDPHGPAQHAELDGDHPVSIMQSIPTIAGKEYTLKFWTSPRPGTSEGDNILRPILNAVALGADVDEGAGGGSTVWTEHTRTFTASGPLANLKFSDLGTDNSLGIYLDDVTLFCAEPSDDDGDEFVDENTPERCTNGLDDDGDESIDASDTDCTPRITVVKHVVNDNSGTLSAGDFDLHVNIAEEEVDDEEQEEFFTFDFISTAFAGLDRIYAPATVIGNEEGTDVFFRGPADYTVTEDPEEGYRATYGEGCSGSIGLGEQKTCIVTNDDIAPTQSPRSSGSGQAYTQGCTNPLATNFNPLANLDDNSCQLPPPPTGGSGTTTQTGGEVQGAAAEEFANELPAGCTDTYLTSYMFFGRPNNPAQVRKLQNFLNEHLGLSLPTTGFYGPLTRNAVKQFQRKYADEILKPWRDAGHPASADGTGHVYKTTLRKINMIKCADLNLPLPSLP